MGTCFTQVEPDEEVHKFRQFSNQYSEDDEPIRKRQCTDKFFFYFMAVFLIVLSGFLLYCSAIGDVNRIIRGYDDCGNVCGEPNNRQVDRDNSCVGINMTQKPFLNTKDSPKQCVKTCEEVGLTELFGRCVGGDTAKVLDQKSGLQALAEDIELCSNEIIYMTMISFLLVGVVIILFRYFTGCFIWCLLIGASSIAVITMIIFWDLYANADNENEKQVYFPFSIMFTIISLIIILVIFVMRKRIKLVIQLFQEASKAIGAIPLLLIQPIATFFAFALTFLFNSYVFILLLSAGNLTKVGAGKYEYLPNDAVVATATLVWAGTIWLMYFYIGCQDMIVGGSVASWYFIRDKSKLGSPIMYSTYNMVRFHLGTVAFGSFIMLIMQIIKAIINNIKKKMRQLGCCLCVECFSCIFDHIQQIIQYFSKLAYIMTAMHGVSFCQGGKQAMKLFMKNGIKMLALNSVGSFILFLVHFIIVTATVLIGINMLNKPGVNFVPGPVIFVAIIAFCMSKCFLTVYDTAIDTIFLCFCEDCEQNDGISKPYYMSKELMLFVQNSKKALANLNKSNESNATETATQAWSGNNQGRNLQQPAAIA